MSAFENIPGLPAGIGLNGTEMFWAVQQGNDVRLTASQLGSYIQQNFSALATVPRFSVLDLPMDGSITLASVFDGERNLNWGDMVIQASEPPFRTPYLVWWNGGAWTVAGK